MTKLEYNEFLKSLATDRFSNEEAIEILDALEYQYQFGWEVSKAYHTTGM